MEKLWFNYDNKCPDKWKFVKSPLIYSCNVQIYRDDSDNSDTKLGKIQIKYKIKSNKNIDKNWLNTELFNMFGRKEIFWSQYFFKRDGGMMPYLKCIYLSELEYNQYKQYIRQMKLERLSK